jgi:hypothetical protein
MIIILNNQILKHVATHHLPSIETKIIALVACDNKYTMESKDEMYLLTFSFIEYLLSFAINLSHATCLRRLKFNYKD